MYAVSTDRDEGCVYIHTFMRGQDYPENPQNPTYAKMGAPLGTFCIFRDVYRDTCRAGNIGMCVGI